MKIGLSIGDFTWPGGPTQLGSALGKVARTADQAGFDSIWVMDHFWQIRMNGPEHWVSGLAEAAGSFPRTHSGDS